MSYLDDLENLSLEYEISDHAEYYELLRSHQGIAIMFRNLLRKAEMAGEYTPEQLKRVLSISYDGQKLAALDGHGNLWLIQWDGRGGIVATMSCQDLPSNLDRFGFKDFKRFFAKNPDVRCVPYVPVECRATAPAA